jgi:prepilin-type N-terminal cleavage/methylation domain-containing protein
MHRQGLYNWLNKNLRGKKGQQGFTLIELLVVVTILGVLAGIVTLSLVGLTTNASVQSCNTEYKTVQAALDAYMADNNLAVLPSTTSAPLGIQSTYTNDMSGGSLGSKTGSVALYNANPTSGSPNYTRNGATQFYYTWDQFGRISGVGSPVVGNGISSNSTGGAVANCAPK